MAMMKAITPIWPKSRPNASVLTNPSASSRPYRPLMGASTSCWTRSPNDSGDGICWYVPGTGEPSESNWYSPAGMSSAATHTATVTSARVVTADGKVNERFFFVGASVVLMRET